MGKKKKKKKMVRTKKKKKKQKVVFTKKKPEKQKVVVMMGAEEIRERSERNWLECMEQLRKSEGFDLTYCPRSGMIPYFCGDRRPCCDLVLLYAKLGIHRYNFLQGKDLQLSSVKKYNKTGGGCVTCAYYITLEAATPCGSLQTFQARVDEGKFRHFLLSCTIARFLGEETKKHVPETVLDNKFLGDFMPELPPENPFKDDTNRFYVLKKSELQDNDDWIRLYLELAVATTNRFMSQRHSLTNLKILEVAMESTRDLSPCTKGLGAYDAIFYIRYEDSCEARVGKDVHRIAIVRRIVDELSETFNLVGRTQTILPSNGSSAMEAVSSQD